MKHPNEDWIESKLKNLPKPKLNMEVKNNMYFSLMRDDLYKKEKNPYRIKKLIFSFVSVLALFIFCFAVISSMMKNNDNTNSHTFTLSIDHKDKVDIKKLLPYRESYVGDNSAVVGILQQLPGNQYMKEGVSLSTKKEPYGIHVHYHSNEKYWSEENVQRIFLYNATTLFILIRNVDEVSFDVKTQEGTQSFQTTRKELESFYGVTLRELSKNQTQWESLLNHTFTDKEKVKAFYENYGHR